MDLIISVDDFTPVPVITGDSSPSVRNGGYVVDDSTNLVAVTADKNGTVMNVEPADVAGRVSDAGVMVSRQVCCLYHHYVTSRVCSVETG